MDAVPFLLSTRPPTQSIHGAGRRHLDPNAVGARSVEEVASVDTAADVVNARSVEEVNLVHGRQRKQCASRVVHGGSSICQHGRQRCRCKECKEK